MSIISMAPEVAWKAALGELEMQMARATYNTWLQGTRALAHDGDEFVIGVRNDYTKDWLETRLHDLISRTLANVLGEPVRVRFVVASEDGPRPTLNGHASGGSLSSGTVPNGTPGNEALPHSASSNGYVGNGHVSNVYGGNGQTTNGNGNGYTGESHLNSRYTFANFVVGPNNRMAHAAALSVSENPGESRAPSGESRGQMFNPLFIYGGVGLGKTHLLHAIGHRCRQDGRRVRYLSAETFTNELVMAIRTKQTPDFRDRYRTLDVLLIDDIQFIAGKEGTQDEFFHTFNELHSLGKQVVISSDRPPKALATLEERLLSRFAWGLTVDIQPPEEETRRAILLAKADDLGCRVPDDVIEFIAHRVRQNIRELEGALNKVVAYAQITGEPIDQMLVQRALADTLRRAERLSAEQVIETVTRYYNVPLDALTSSSRKSTVAYPRQVAMYLARTETDASLPQIGALLGNRDHTTVLHGYEKISGLVEIDPQLRRDVLEIKALLYQG